MVIRAWSRASRWLHHRPRLDRPTGQPNPFEAYLLTVCVVQGGALLSGYAAPMSVQTVMPQWVRILWACLLLVGGGTAVIGLYWPWDPIDGVLIKRFGLILAGGGTLAYGVAVLAVYGTSGTVVAIYNIGFSLACAARLRQVSRAIRKVREELAEIRRLGEQP